MATIYVETESRSSEPRKQLHASPVNRTKYDDRRLRSSYARKSAGLSGTEPRLPRRENAAVANKRSDLRGFRRSSDSPD